MEILSGSQISPFIAATSLVWSSSIVLVMVGLVYFIKYKERNDSMNNSKFLLLYFLTIVLNIMEYVLNMIMDKNPSYEMFVYRTYILVGFLLNISVMFYVIKYIKPESKSKFSFITLVNIVLSLAALACCIFLDIDVALETNGKFYVLTGTLNTVYNFYAIGSNMVLLFIVLVFRKKMPKGFFALCLLIFFIYMSIFIFEKLTGYIVKDTVFIYSLLVLVIFNTTSNQDKELVTKLSTTNTGLLTINNRRNKLANKVTYQLGQSLNDLVLYNDEIYMNKVPNRAMIEKDSKEIYPTAVAIDDYIVNIKDIFSVELNSAPVNSQYKLSTLVNNIKNKVQPVATTKNISFNLVVEDKTLSNYIGDVSKIEKAIINILYNAINNTQEVNSINLIIASKQHDQKKVELAVTVKNNGIAQNIDLAKSSINDFIETNKKYGKYDIKMIVTNRLLEIMNSKIDIKTEENNTIYSFSIVQGFKDSELYNN